MVQWVPYWDTPIVEILSQITMGHVAIFMLVVFGGLIIGKIIERM